MTCFARQAPKKVIEAVLESGHISPIKTKIRRVGIGQPPVAVLDMVQAANVPKNTKSAPSVHFNG
jgi:hypothetical protein